MASEAAAAANAANAATPALGTGPSTSAKRAMASSTEQGEASQGALERSEEEEGMEISTIDFGSRPSAFATSAATAAGIDGRMPMWSPASYDSAEEASPAPMSSSTWVQERSESGEWSSLAARTRASAGE